MTFPHQPQCLLLCDLQIDICSTSQGLWGGEPASFCPTLGIRAEPITPELRQRRSASPTRGLRGGFSTSESSRDPRHGGELGGVGWGG